MRPRTESQLAIRFGNLQGLHADEAVVMLECRDNLDFMRSLSNESMKLIVTSPPYNIGKVYERRSTLET